MASSNTETRKRTRKESGGNALAAIGMLLGAGLGAAVALVYSPGSGKKNRKNLNLWAHHRLDDLQRKAEGVVKRDT
ncbi:MAG: YtxH domain-containing protein [Chloroflexia bacterium]